MRFVSVAFLLTTWLLTPTPAVAQDSLGGIVTCSGIGSETDSSLVPCDFCELLKTTNNVIEFLITISITIAVLMIAYAGIRLVISAGNTQAKEAAKGFLTNAIIGLIIILASWLIVDTVMKILIGNNNEIGVWNEIECPAQPVPDPVNVDFGDLNNVDLSGRHLAGGARAGGTCGTIDDPSNACHPDNLSCFGSSAGAASSICNKESGGEPVMSGTDKCKDGRSFSGGAFQVNVLAHSDKIPGCSAGSFSTSGGGPQGSCVERRTNSKGVSYCAVWNCEFSSQSAYDSCKAGALDVDLNKSIACQLYNDRGGFDDWRLSANLCNVTEGVNEWDG